MSSVRENPTDKVVLAGIHSDNCGKITFPVRVCIKKVVNPGLKTPLRKLYVIYTLYATSTWLYTIEELQVLQERAYSSSGYGAQPQIRAS